MIVFSNRIVSCQACGGHGYTRAPMGLRLMCRVCHGTGHVRMMPGEIWCNYCNSTGQVNEGLPGFAAMHSCPVCGGTGKTQV